MLIFGKLVTLPTTEVSPFCSTANDRVSQHDEPPLLGLPTPTGLKVAGLAFSSLSASEHDDESASSSSLDDMNIGLDFGGGGGRPSLIWAPTSTVGPLALKCAMRTVDGLRAEAGADDLAKSLASISSSPFSPSIDIQ